MEDFRETRFEALGAGHFDPNVAEEKATEVVGKIGLKHREPKAIQLPWPKEVGRVDVSYISRSMIYKKNVSIEV